MRSDVLLLAATAVFFAQASIAGTGHVVAALEARAPAPMHVANACEFQPPSPILVPNTYTGQTLERQSDNQLMEKAQLSKGLRIEILQSACADFVTTEFTLIVQGEQRLQLDQNGWIDLARSTLAGLKMRKPAGAYSELNDFLKRAKDLPPDEGILASCRDGSKARPGECSWESLGGFIYAVKRTKRTTRVSITQYLSG